MSKSRPGSGAWLAGALIAAAPAIAMAQSESEVRCSMGDEVRRVVTMHETDAPVPCSVRYRKETEAPGAPAEVLWSAQNEAGYCEARAAEFVERLKSWGWQCAVDAAAAASEN